MITQKELKGLFDYDKDTGLFTRKVKTSNKCKIGSVAGSLCKNGYVYICINFKKYLAHRLAWVYEYGEVPKIIDHVNRNKLDNRICNLRNTTSQINNLNTKIHVTNKTGYKGVSFIKRDNKYYASISVNNKTKNLGMYDSPEKAALAYDKFVKENYEVLSYGN